MEIKLALFVNQIGYLPQASKYAYATGMKGGEPFSLIDSATSKVVFEGTAASPKTDHTAGEPVCCLDFSDFKTPGSYYITTKTDDKAAVKSVPVYIGSGLYSDIYYSSLNYFYLSRCGQDIDGGVWSHQACHNTPALIYGTDIKKEVNGGWHDAGDYGRYVVAASKAVMDLLLAYEQSLASFNKFDILAEVRFELEWMLKMQREDGGVFHKVSCYHFCGFINPQDEKDELVIAPVSTTATADFAGCLSFASDFFKESDPVFAKKLMSAALLSYKYMDTNPEEPFKNPPDITTGGYGDWSSVDERYFACASLFLRTGDETYLKKAMRLRQSIVDAPKDPALPWKNVWYEGFGWGMVAGYGTELLLRARDKIQDKGIIDTLEQSMLGAADRLLARVNATAFGTSLDKVMWGSSGHVCDNAHVFLVAWELSGDKAYYEAAKKQIDYILGCNPNNICFVTGFGSNTVKNPHHRPSVATGQTVPGMLSGGPCEGLFDACAKEKLEALGLPPLRCFIDDIASYSTNEVAIYWNSTFVYIASKLKLV